MLISRLGINLTQHTPLIHFQHDQTGATLRASEVKPRLDRYIIEKLGDGEYEKGVKIARNINWCIKGARYPVLEYRLRIVDKDPRPKNERIIDTIKLISEALVDKKGISSNNVIATFLSFNDSLLNRIKEITPEFFLLTNFGTRQTKAWGNYYHEIHSDWNQIKNTLLDLQLPVYVLDHSLPFEDREKTYNFYRSTVGTTWRALKSGINLTNKEGIKTYKKALLFKYLCSQGIRWDKRWIKQRINEMILNKKLPAKLSGKHQPNDCIKEPILCDDPKSINSWEDDQTLNHHYRFGRAMLGLPEHFEFIAENNYIYRVIVTNDSGINRFHSPVLFKVFNDKLFAITQQPLTMMDQEFGFKIQKKKKPFGGGKPINEDEPIKVLKSDGTIDTLKTPINLTEFNIETLLDTYFPCVGFKRLTQFNSKDL